MEKLTFLTFVLGDDLFAVNVVNVLEVLEQQQITRVPKAPAHILGIINFRGEILPVVNTRIKFSLPANGEDTKKYIIVYDLVKNNEQYTIAATADGVKDVIEVTEDEIKPVPEMGLSFDVRYISGVIRRNERFVLLIHPDQVFSASDTNAIVKEETIIQ